MPPIRHDRPGSRSGNGQPRALAAAATESQLTGTELTADATAAPTADAATLVTTFTIAAAAVTGAEPAATTKSRLTGAEPAAADAPAVAATLPTAAVAAAVAAAHAAATKPTAVVVLCASAGAMCRVCASVNNICGADLLIC